jgi:hypothetical protein
MLPNHPLTILPTEVSMKANRVVLVCVAAGVMLTSLAPRISADTSKLGSGKIKHVILISIDGVHALDFHNCANGITGVNGGYSSTEPEGNQLASVMTIPSVPINMGP